MQLMRSTETHRVEGLERWEVRLVMTYIIICQPPLLREYSKGSFPDGHPLGIITMSKRA